jgi:hypothetical protein
MLLEVSKSKICNGAEGKRNNKSRHRNSGYILLFYYLVYIYLFIYPCVFKVSHIISPFNNFMKHGNISDKYDKAHFGKARE